MDTVEFLRRRIPHKQWGEKEPLEVLIPLPIVHAAADEIETLRAGKFRWIPLTERGPLLGDSDRDGNVLVRAHNGGVFPRHFASVLATLAHTHWAPIPPVPEKDEELWRKWAVANTTSVHYEIAFKAGLKAARGEKP